MTLSLCSLLIFITFTLGCRSPADQPAEQTAKSRTADARATNAAGALPQASGQFDYYLLTLSWSPEYCHGHPNAAQCDGEHPGFVVHGLWPQNNDGRWPSHCSTEAGLPNPTTMLDIMPDPRLIAHEWTTHGTCTGLTASQYFHTIRAAYDRIRIPDELRHPTQIRRSSAAAIKQMFVDANPKFSTDDIAISCHNRYLAGVSFCLSKSLQPIACQSMRDCDARSTIVPAMR